MGIEEDFLVRDVDYRRRRLRMIKTEQEGTQMNPQLSPGGLTIMSDIPAARADIESLKQRLFAECRGKQSVTLQIEQPDAAPIVVIMDRPYLLIGRGSACDLQLDHEEIKPRHCYLQWIDGELFCCDIAQRNSFFPDRHASSHSRWFDREPISIGPYRLSLIGEEVSQPLDFSPLERSPQLAAEYPHLGLQFDGVEQTNNLWPVNRMLTMIGRGSQCKLRLNHKSIADVHACLIRTPHGCWLVDLINDGTTGVNGKAIRLSPVDIGDTLQLGSFQIEVTTMAFHPIVPSLRSETANSSSILATSLPPLRRDRQPQAPLQEQAELQEQSSLAACVDSPLCAADELQTEQTPNVLTEEPREEPCIPLSEPAMETVEEPCGIAVEDGLLKTEPSVQSQAVSQFIQQQQSQLATLKLRLMAMKEVYETAVGNLISKRMRDALEAPVVETLSCHDAMQELLDQFIKSLKYQPD